MTNQAIIGIQLPKDRTGYGVINMHAVVNSQWTQVVSAICLGKSDNLAAAKVLNPLRNSTKKYGDTPTGVYIATYKAWWTPADSKDLHSYGEKKIDIDPIQKAAEVKSVSPMCRILMELVALGVDIENSDAAKAERNKRDNLLIHGGDLRDGLVLRPTMGCIRVENDVAKNIADHTPKEGCICFISEDYQLVDRWVSQCRKLPL